MTKKQAQQRHAKRRAEERYGVTLGKVGRREVLSQIASGKAKFIGRQSVRVSGFEVLLEGKLLKVLYDRKRKSIVTVLPSDAVWHAESGLDCLLEGSSLKREGVPSKAAFVTGREPVGGFIDQA